MKRTTISFWETGSSLQFWTRLVASFLFLPSPGKPRTQGEGLASWFHPGPVLRNPKRSLLPFSRSIVKSDTADVRASPSTRYKPERARMLQNAPNRVRNALSGPHSRALCASYCSARGSVRPISSYVDMDS